MSFNQIFDWWEPFPANLSNARSEEQLRTLREAVVELQTKIQTRK
jgi:hypothetical protein